MEPTSYLKFSQDGLVYAYSGRDVDTPCFTWNCSTFEYFMNEAATPSMLHFMQNHVVLNLSEGDMWAIQGGTYTRGQREADAVEAYFATPIQERIDLHNEENEYLEEMIRIANAKEADAARALLDENRPWDRTSPIDQEYIEFLNKTIIKTQEQINDLHNQLHEENNWVGGHERDAEMV